jgi:hypothetical protein
MLRLLTFILTFTALFLGSAWGANCDSTFKGYVPLPQLTGLYKGQMGGLYPLGQNIPPASHDSAGRARAASFLPLDTAGNPDSSGVWILLSVGMSNCTQEFSTFMNLVQFDSSLHRHLRIADGAQGGQTAEKIMYDTAAFWQVIRDRLSARGLSPKQVQAIWLKEADVAPSGEFPIHAKRFRDELVALLQVIYRQYPNIKQVFLSSRIYGGYASTSLNPEPYAYEYGFSVRWVIEAQLNGVDSLNFDSSKGVVRAPWIAWGPYLWADGVTPRQGDSLQWFCSDLRETDGTHPSADGQAKVAAMLRQFFTTSPYTKSWYLGASSSTCCQGTTGDANSSGSVNLADLSALVAFLVGGDFALQCRTEADVNGSGSVDLADLSALSNYLTGGGYVLPSCP